MYLDFLVKIPISSEKITYRKKGNTDYVYYEYKRIYTKGSNITNPKRVTIGKRDKEDPLMMLPNENYLKYFPDEDLPEINERTKRSSCLRIGTWIVIRKIMEEYRFFEIIGKYINKKDLGLVLDLAAYSIIYKSRDNSEKLFRGDKSYLGDKSLRIYGDSAAESKIFIEFIALIIRNKIYNCLKDEFKAQRKPALASGYGNIRSDRHPAGKST